MLDPQKFVDPDDSNDSEAVAPEQEGGSRGIQRRRRAVTQQQNRDRAMRAVENMSTEELREYAARTGHLDSLEDGHLSVAAQELAEQTHSALQPITDTVLPRDNENFQTDEIRHVEDSGDKENYPFVQRRQTIANMGFATYVG